MKNEFNQAGGKNGFGAAVLGLALCGMLAGCAEGDAYTKPTGFLLPTNVQKIMVPPFKNRTQFFGLEDRLRLKVEQEFIRDGRLPYVSDEAQAEGSVQGEIVNYIRQVATYDANNQPLEYKLWVIMNVRFQDLKESKLLWEEPRMEQTYRYFIETEPGGMTEEEARDRVWDLFARDIVKRTIEGFGSVTGASEKKVPENTLPSTDKNAPEPAPRPKVPPPPPY